MLRLLAAAKLGGEFGHSISNSSFFSIRRGFHSSKLNAQVVANKPLQAKVNVSVMTSFRCMSDRIT